MIANRTVVGSNGVMLVTWAHFSKRGRVYKRTTKRIRDSFGRWVRK